LQRSDDFGITRRTLFRSIAIELQKPEAPMAVFAPRPRRELVEIAKPIEIRNNKVIHEDE